MKAMKMSGREPSEPGVTPPRGLYFHIPFCVSRCRYCDFNSYSGLQWLSRRYTVALQRELLLWSQLPAPGADRRPIETLYFGGGTPTLLGTENLLGVLKTAGRLFHLQAVAEATIETNPGVADVKDMTVLRRAGLNRVSMGVQSFDDAELRFLGRIHNAIQAEDSWSALRRAGFENASLDLMYGLPGQSIGSWRTNLEMALSLEPEHLSLYALTIEEETPLAKAIARGEVSEPDSDLAAEMYSLAEDILEDAGYVHYEISNWARPGRECLHNLNYWRDGSYLGVGAGAHSYLGEFRIANEKSPIEYVRGLETESAEKLVELTAEDEAEKMMGLREAGLPVASLEHIDRSTSMAETMMLGLRLSEGVSESGFCKRFGVKPEDIYGSQIIELKKLGLLEQAGDQLRLTSRGRLLGNQVFCRFVG